MIKTINNYVEVWNTQEIEKLPTVFAKSTSYQDALQKGNAISALSASIRETATAFPDLAFEICSVIKGTDGETFVLEWAMKGTNTGPFYGAEPTNKKIKIHGVDIIEFRGEKIASLKSFYDSSQFTTQLGL